MDDFTLTAIGVLWLWAAVAVVLWLIIGGGSINMAVGSVLGAAFLTVVLWALDR